MLHARCTTNGREVRTSRDRISENEGFISGIRALVLAVLSARTLGTNP